MPERSPSFSSIGTSKGSRSTGGRYWPRAGAILPITLASPSFETAGPATSIPNRLLRECAVRSLEFSSAPIVGSGGSPSGRMELGRRVLLGWESS